MSVRAAALAVSMLAIALALTVARPHGTPGPLMRDFESYYAAGQTWSAHADPYSTAIWTFEKAIPGVQAARGELLPFVGPPAFLPFWAFFSLLPFSVAALLWGAILLAAAAAILIGTLRSTDALSIGAVLAGACMLVGFAPFTSDLALGQAALLSFAACAGATLWFDRSRIVSGIWSFFAAMQPNVAITLLSQAGRRLTWPALLGAGLCFLAVCAATVGVHGQLAYGGGLIAHGQAERFALIQITPAAVAYGFGLPAGLAQFIGTLATVAAFIIALAVIRLPYVKPLWKLAIVSTLLPFAVPFFHEHDFVVVLLAVLLCALSAEKRTWTIAATGTMLCAVDWLGLAQRPSGLLQSVLLAMALVLALFAFTEQRARSLLVPAGVVLLLIGAGLLAPNHAAPVWPDAMHGVTTISGPLAEIWHGELLRSGEFSREPFWAAMRLLSLSGAAMLAWASISAAQERDQLEIS